MLAVAVSLLFEKDIKYALPCPDPPRPPLTSTGVQYSKLSAHSSTPPHPRLTLPCLALPVELAMLFSYT